MERIRNWWRNAARLDSALLLVALTAGISGAILSTRLLDARAAAAEQALRNRYATRAVVVAATDLPAGESLDAARLAVRDMPSEFLAADAIPADRATELLGGQTIIPIRRGTPVVPAALRTEHSPRSLSSMLQVDQRALTIGVDQVNSQAGNLRPGDWVDLHYAQGSGDDSVLVPLLQRVEVLAAGNAMLGNIGGGELPDVEHAFSTITLGLTPEQATRVVLAQQSGSLSVVLRAPADASTMTSTVRRSRDLLRAAPPGRPAPADTRIELLVGGQGNLLPERSWLSVGQGQAARAGDAS